MLVRPCANVQRDPTEKKAPVVWTLDITGGVKAPKPKLSSNKYERKPRQRGGNVAKAIDQSSQMKDERAEQEGGRLRQRAAAAAGGEGASAQDKSLRPSKIPTKPLSQIKQEGKRKVISGEVSVANQTVAGLSRSPQGRSPTGRSGSNASSSPQPHQSPSAAIEGSASLIIEAHEEHHSEAGGEGRGLIRYLKFSLDRCI